MNQAEVYDLFARIDRDAGLMGPRVGKWCAWPIAKMQLVWHLMEATGANGSGRRSLWGKLRERLPRYASDVATAFRQAGRIAPVGDGGTIAMIYLPRVHTSRAGVERDFIFGDLLQGEGLAVPVVRLEQPWSSRGPRQMTARATIALGPYQSAADQLAVVLMASPRLQRVASALNARLDSTGIPLDSATRARKMLLAMALFEARRRIFRRLFRRIDARAVVLTNAAGRAGEIAAAKELGLPVLELQHGIIPADCPDYAWPPSFRVHRADMALPDRIAVFGPLFQRLLLRSGFWRESEIACTGAAIIEQARQDPEPPARAGRRPRLIFMTQSASRDMAVPFWREFVTLSRNAVDSIAIKVHPAEKNHMAAYRELAALAPGRFTLLDAEANPIDAMHDADIVVSYNSMALIEALGLGRPAVSLCGGPIPHGIAGLTGLADLARVIPHVDSPAALNALVAERAGDAAMLARWRADASASAGDFFSEDFARATAAEINELVLGRRRDPIAA